MGKYIKTFDTHDEYETYIGGGEAILPNVSYCKNINDVHYNPFLVGINTYISCVDIASGEELAGSHIQVLDQDGVEVEEWTSTTEVHEVEGLNKETTYTLRTTVAPNGYVLATATTFTIDGTGQITYSGNTTTDEDGNTVLLVEMGKTIVKVSCVNNADGADLEGSHIQVIDSVGRVTEEWVSTTEPHTIEGLNVNEEYTLKTTVASEGFILPTDTTFTIDETGRVTSTGTITEDGIMLVELAKTQVQVLCVDIASGDEVEGTHIQVIDKDGYIAEEWDSTTEAHEVNGLKTGETYTLRTTVASDGYLPASETTFSIDETGEVTSTGTISEEGILFVEMEKTKVQVSCVNIADGEELAGSHIQVLDQDGRVVEEWDSTTEAHEIEGLKTGIEYTLRTTVASEGFILPTDTTFTIDETGRVTSTGTITEDGIMLVELAKTQVQVLCVDIADGADLEGSTIQVLDSVGRVTEEWVSTTEPHTIEGLKTGETYTLRNTVASDGYKVTTDTTFSIDETGRVRSTGTISEDGIMLVELAKTQVQVSCVDIADGADLEGSTIQVLDQDGRVVEEWDSTTEAHQIEGLKTGIEYTLRNTVASEGYVLATDTTFSIDETGRVRSTGTISEDGILFVELAKTQVQVLCVDETNREEVEHVNIQLNDSEEMIEEWASTTEPHMIEGLKTGETYTLRTTIVPEEYLPSTETTFTIDETGRVRSTGTISEDGILFVELRHK